MPRKEAPANLDQLSELIRFISEFAESNGFSGDRLSKIHLVAEEALVNIFKYAYPEAEGNVQVSVDTDDRGRCVIEFSDTGVPFDPSSANEPDLTSEVAERDIGKLGIFFIRRMSDEVHYWRDGNRNILTLILEKP
ncbi:MAG: ATP-binding protein [Deltaproteobacteria bacterium]|nr:ATP-binding protein [Deltaproteobacteria bacterium]